MGWSFTSRAVHGVCELRSELLEYFHDIQSSPASDELLARMATGLRHLLKDVNFYFFLFIILSHDALYGALDSRLVDGASV